MRITSFSIFNQLTRSLQENMKTLFKYSERLSTGKKINKPSDDPTGMARVIDYKARLSENEQYARNIDDAYSYVQFAESVMSNVTDSLTRARELAVQAANASQTADSRESISQEIANIRDEINNLSNSRFRDKYIFSGYSTDTAAFDSSYVYQGDTGEVNVMIDRNGSVAVNVVGSSAFSYGGEAFAQTLEDFRSALASNDVTGIQQAITDIDNMLNQVSVVRADLGARLSYLDKQKTNLEDRNYALTTFLSNTEDDDITSTVSEIAKTQVALEALRTSGSSVMSQSLLDFLK